MTENKESKIVTLLWGLPGSGKTTFAREIVPENQRFLPSAQKSRIIDADMIFLFNELYPLFSEGQESRGLDADPLPEAAAKKRAKRVKKLVAEVCDAMTRMGRVVIDGLFATNKAAEEVFAAVKQECKSEVFFEIFWWAEDKEACLWNDKKRGRKFDSSVTIAAMPFETPSQELLRKFGIPAEKCVEKTVVRKSRAKVLAQQHDLGDTATLASHTWTLGGTSGSCYGDGLQRVDPTPQPVTFKEFDDLLEELCPQVTFLQYKKLHSKTVTIKTHTSNDYYGGSVDHANFECDLPALVEMLEDMNLLARAT